MSSLLLSACSGPAAQQNGVPSGAVKEAKGKDSLTIVQSAETRDFNTIDPMQKDITLPRTFIYETLVTRDKDGKLVPLLAESYEFQGNSWRIKLRKGIKFHNGDELNAESVKATLDKLLKEVPKSTFKTLLASVQETKLVDTYTVDIVTKTPNYALINFLVDLPIQSAVLLAKGEAYKTEMNGTGPYILEEWKRGEKAVLKQAPNYWGDKPPFKSVVIKYVPDEAARIAELLSGSADIASDLNVNSIQRVKGQNGFHVESEPGYRVSYMGYFFKPPFDNVKLRQALYYGVDRQSLAKNLYGEYATPATAPVTKGGSGYVEAFPLSDYNTDKARQLIAESGVKTPVTVDFDTTQRDVDAAQILQSQLKKLGIETNINIRETSAIFDQARYDQSKNGSILLFTGFDNPDREIYRLLTPAYSKASFFSSFGYKPVPELEPLINDYVAEPDEQKRLALSKKILDRSKEDAAVNWLLFPANIYGISNTIDWKPDGTGRIDIKKIKVK
jgi:peptide/nickel transport system substrate-binding protein